nr:RdRp [signal crayfish associated chu-like virus 3]
MIAALQSSPLTLTSNLYPTSPNATFNPAKVARVHVA